MSRSYSKGAALCALGFVSTLLACSSDSSGSRAGGFGGTGDRGIPSAQPGANSDAGVANGGSSFWLQVSADDSTSMASAQIAKVEGASRVGLHRHEFMNYYDPPQGLFGAEPWAITGSPAPSIAFGLSAATEPLVTDADGGTSSELAMTLQLVSAPVDSTTRRPWNLVFCVDVSGSMMEGGKMEFVKSALLASLGRMRAGDHLTLVTFSSGATLVYDDLTWPQDEQEIRASFQALVPEGGTNMIAGLRIAYERAAAQRESSRLTRVLVFGDGDANVGDTDLATFREATRVGNEEGIYLSSVGVGFNFDWARMDQLADAGKGASVFLPNAEEAMRQFGTEQFTKLVEVAADEVDVELELPVGLTLADFSGEETSTDPNARVPSVILAAGDDLTMLARFRYTDASVLDGPMTVRVQLRPLGTGELVTFERTVAHVTDLLVPVGGASRRARLVDDFARRTIGDPGAPTAEELLARIADVPAADPGLLDIASQLAR